MFVICVFGLSEYCRMGRRLREETQHFAGVLIGHQNNFVAE